MNIWLAFYVNNDTILILGRNSISKDNTGLLIEFANVRFICRL